MRRAGLLAALALAWVTGGRPAFALNHLSANRVHLYTPGSCAAPLNPLWLTLGLGRAAPGFHNLTDPQFDQIAALVTGNGPATPEARLAAQMPNCGVIAAFYQDATQVGAWPVPEQDLPLLNAIISQNG